jgi:5-methylcytosine-specific restriction endonuclease McrA
VRAEYQRHAALYAMASSLDHIVPHGGRGGRLAYDNFVTACYCCQFGRGEWTLEESGLNNPMLRSPVVDAWDGLSRLDRSGKLTLHNEVQPSIA